MQKENMPNRRWKKMKVFIVKSWTAPPKSVWRPWLEKELKIKGIQAEIVQGLPEIKETTLEKWIKEISKAVGKPDEKTILVGHSLGCISILKYLETIGAQIAGCVFVAGFAESVGFPEHKSFFEKPLDWEKINANCKKFICIYSDNDPYVPVERIETFKKQLKATTILVKNAGHFGREENCTELPVALESVLEIAGKNK